MKRTLFYNYCIILTTLGSSSLAWPSRNAPEEEEDEGKIVGGFEANKEDYPYAVSLRTEKNNHFCGGTLIDDKHVVTAAHCVIDGHAKYVVVGSDSLDKGGVRYSVLSSHLNPDYDATLLRNDIAVLTIAEKVTYEASFPTRSRANISNYENSCYVMGWGRTKAGGKLSNKFKVAAVHPIKPAECEKEWDKFYNPKLICTSSKDNAACNGDSGGPLICEDTYAGIVSFGKPCATGKPDMFTAVYAYNDFIESVIREK